MPSFACWRLLQLVMKDMRRKTTLVLQLLTIVALALAFSPAGYADCYCEYINGVMQPMCGSSLDLRPTCATTTYVPAYTARPVLPPLRAESCRPAMICNGHGFCRWRWVCD
jgi:hypothetical protein